MRKKMHILIVEDSLISAEYLRGILEDTGYIVSGITDTGTGAIKLARQLKPDLILMDIILKDNVSGSEAAVQIYHDLPDCKIIFLTAHADADMIDYAQRSKAYAYLMKPYREKEILATLQLALSAEAKKTPSPDKIKLSNGYSFDTTTRRLYRKEKEITLSRHALKLIEVLVKNRNTTVSNEQISHHVWGESKNDNTIRALLHRIRENVDEDLIHNIKGVGYIISSEAN